MKGGRRKRQQQKLYSRLVCDDSVPLQRYQQVPWYVESFKKDLVNAQTVQMYVVPCTVVRTPHKKCSCGLPGKIAVEAVPARWKVPGTLVSVLNGTERRLMYSCTGFKLRRDVSIYVRYWRTLTNVLAQRRRDESCCPHFPITNNQNPRTNESI